MICPLVKVHGDLDSPCTRAQFRQGAHKITLSYTPVYRICKHSVTFPSIFV
jgi:hypothetical protein